jgi:uncharacterized repeat protein (TIGR01451 family)
MYGTGWNNLSKLTGGAMHLKRATWKSLTIGLVAMALVVMSTTTLAHPVTIDGRINDWFYPSTPLTNPGAYPNPNTSHIARNAQGQGEFIWRDINRDQRINSTAVFTRDADLRTFRVTADSTNLYLNINLDSMGATPGKPGGYPAKAVEAQVAIDRDPNGANHTTLVGLNASDLPTGVTTVPDINTSVSPDAGWEYLVQTRYPKTITIDEDGYVYYVAKPRIWSSPTTGSATVAGAEGTHKPDGFNFIELKIPWTAIGGAPAAGSSIRFSVATLYADRSSGSDGDTLTSAVIDTISRSQTAFEDLQDGVIDNYVDVSFDANGEPYSPLAITEFMPNPPGVDATSASTEWIELTNISGVSIELSNYKLGDASTKAGTEGMRQFPAQTLGAGERVIVAKDKTKFNAIYPSVAGLPGVTVYGYDELVSPYPGWGGTASIDLLDAANGTVISDDVVLLGANDTIVDLVNYAFDPVTPTFVNPYQAHVPISMGAGIPEDRSYERCPATRDTNNGNTDFITHDGVAAHTPGVDCGLAEPDLAITKTGATSVAIGNTFNYTINYGNVGTTATNVTISDSLPAGLSYVSHTGGAGFSQSGNDLTWALGTLTSGSSGSIVITVQVANDSNLIGDQLSNTATIAGAETDGNPANNSSTLVTTITDIARADLSISKALSSGVSGVYDGQLVSFAIDYANNGDLGATDVIITDTLTAPVGTSLTFDSVECSPACTTEEVNGETVVRIIGSVASGADGLVVLTYRLSTPIAGGASITNDVTISTSALENQLGDNSDSVTVTTVAAPADLTVVKSSNKTSVPVGGDLVYTLVVSNEGAQAATSVSLVDTLPAGLSYVAGSTTGAGEPQVSGNGRTLTWTPAGGNLAAGGTWTVTFTVRATAVATGLVNTAVVSGTGEVETENNGASSQAVAVVEARIFLPITTR